jgi:hypothetical protein
MKRKGKLRGKKETEKIFTDNDLTKQEREIHTEKTMSHRERRRNKGKKVKVGYMKITIKGVQRRWDEERGRLEVFQ